MVIVLNGNLPCKATIVKPVIYGHCFVRLPPALSVADPGFSIGMVPTSLEGSLMPDTGAFWRKHMQKCVEKRKNRVPLGAPPLIR